MCGIFGFALKKPQSIDKVFRVLEKLEILQYPQEKTPLGGYGAGLAVLMPDGAVVSEKLGKISKSPAASLAEIVKPNVKKASVLLAHVRMPSPEFMETAEHKETAQPYVVEFDPNLTIVSAHNGKMENYREIRERFGRKHVFESERYQLIDSEVVPHYFEEILEEEEDPAKAVTTLFEGLQGPNTTSILQIQEENTYLHFVHKGKTRGLNVWTNQQGEVVFCSRKEPMKNEFEKVLTKGKFQQTVAIGCREDAKLKLTFPIDWEIKA